MPINFDALIQQINAAQQQANMENAQRYQDLLGHLNFLGQQVGAAGTFGQAENLLNQVGTAARTRIGEQKARALATTEQALTSRGLGGTTIRTTARRGVMSDAERARQEMEEKLAQQRVGLLTQRAGFETQIGGMKAAAIEGRQDVGPNLAMFASLLQAAAAGEAAAPGTQRVATVIGPQAQAGRSVFGTPFRYGGSGGIDPFSPSSGGGGGGGGVSAAPTLSASARGTIPYTATGAARGAPTTGWGTIPGQEAAAVGGAGETAIPSGPREPTESEAGIIEMAKEMAGPEAAEKIGFAGTTPPATDKEVITDYNEYVRRVGRSKAVSAMYFNNVWGGQWSPGGR